MNARANEALGYVEIEVSGPLAKLENKIYAIIWAVRNNFPDIKAPNRAQWIYFVDCNGKTERDSFRLRIETDRPLEVRSFLLDLGRKLDN